VDDDFHKLRPVETEFSAIVVDDIFTSQTALSYESKNSSCLGLRNTYRLRLKNDMPPRDKSVETKFSAIVVDDIFTSQTALSYESKSDKDNDNKEIDIIQSSRFRFGKAVLELDTGGALQFQLGGVRRRISSAWDFLGTSLSYTLIMDLMLRLCHRLIACSFAERSQAPEM
nr:hypothetical protein [Tanacetum cinerariifolium]